MGQGGKRERGEGRALKHEPWSKVAVSILRVIRLAARYCEVPVRTGRVIQGLHNSVQVSRGRVNHITSHFHR